MARAAHNSNWDPWTGEEIRPSKQRDFHIYLLEKSFGKLSLFSVFYKSTNSCCEQTLFFDKLSQYLQTMARGNFLVSCFSTWKSLLWTTFLPIIVLCNLLSPTNFITLFANCYFRVRVVGVIKWSGWSGWSGWLGGLDDMHSENICFSWSKPSNYWKKVEKSHLWRMDGRTDLMKVGQFSS